MRTARGARHMSTGGERTRARRRRCAALRFTERAAIPHLWPPMTTNSFGSSAPGRSMMMLRLGASASVCASM